MAVYLLKTEPSEYGYDDLVRDGRAAWEGVSNPAAQKCLRGVRAGDYAIIYHTGDEKRIAGVASVVRGAYPDPGHPELTAAGDPKRVLIDIAPLRAASATLTLADIKSDPAFAGLELLRQPRLSVMPVPDDIVAALLGRAGLGRL